MTAFYRSFRKAETNPLHTDCSELNGRTLETKQWTEPYKRKSAVLKLLNNLDPADVFAVIEIDDSECRTTQVYYQQEDCP